MTSLHPRPLPPGEPAWDIVLTRLSLALRPQLVACASDLARRFRSIGVGSDLQVRQMPRGLSVILALVGRRGLIGLVELTLLDGMAVGRGPCTVLDVRLLDACGELIEEDLAHGMTSPAPSYEPAARAFRQEDLEQAATTIYVAALAHFDLLQPVSRCQ